MAISVAPDSAKITITKRPTVQTPTIGANAAVFDCTNVAASGQVTLNGAVGDDASQWTAGFIQAQWIETNWAYYRGAQNNDGSLFIQRARPPARPRQACRDCVGPASDVFYSTQPGDGEIDRGDPNSAFPALLSVQHYDKPGDNWALVETNSFTGQPNYLEAAQLEFSFCTALSLRDSTGAFRHLSHFYWNVNWQAQFQRVHAGGFRVIPDANGTSANVGGPYAGAPNDPRFMTILTSAQSRNCNDFAAAETQAVAAPGNLNRRESRTWTNFDVTG